MNDFINILLTDPPASLEADLVAALQSRPDQNRLTEDQAILVAIRWLSGIAGVSKRTFNVRLTRALKHAGAVNVIQAAYSILFGILSGKLGLLLSDSMIYAFKGKPVLVEAMLAILDMDHPRMVRDLKRVEYTDYETVVKVRYFAPAFSEVASEDYDFADCV